VGAHIKHSSCLYLKTQLLVDSLTSCKLRKSLVHDLSDQDQIWRLYLRNWIPLAFLAQLLALSVATSTFSLQIDSLFCQAMIAVGAFAVAGRYLFASNCGRRLAVILLSEAQLQVLILLGTPLSYIAASANFPLQDAALAHYDQLLGLNWRNYYEFVLLRPALTPYTYLSYAMIGLLPTAVPLILGLTKQSARLQNFTLACTLSVCVTALLSAVVPAIGTYYQYDLPAELPNFKASGYLVQLHDLPIVRDGALRSLYITHLGGIVTFPSYHAAAAVLDMWALWGVWWMRPFALIANAGMLLATPLVGGHYFVDVIAGVTVAVLAIAVSKKIPGPSTLFHARTIQTPLSPSV
jgi:membrane-associated phospholipid phosphatase